VVVALSCLGCGPSGDADVVAFVDVNVISMATEGVLVGQTVVVRDGLIAEVGTTGEVSVPRGAARVDGAGERYLMPGLVDTHVHLEAQLDAETWLPLFVANGVTTVFNLTGAPSTLELRRRVEEWDVLGPTIYTSGPFANLPQVTTPEDAETWVRAQKRAGYDFVKVHGPVAEDAFIRMNEVGRSIDMPILGHAPRNLPFDAVLENGQVAVVHAEELIYTYFQQLDESRIPDLARRMADAGTYLTTTVSMFENIVRQWGVPVVMDTVLALPEARYLSPKMRAFWTRGNPYTGRPVGREQVGATYRFQLELVQQLHEAGVPLMLGTDTPLPVMYPGSSLLQDVENLSRAGLDASEVLAAGTRIPGDFISQHVDPGERFGTVAVGSRADLILLEANPLEDLDALSSPSGVMVRGRWFDRAALDGLLDGIAQTFAGMEEEYDDPAIAMSAEELAPFAGRFNAEGWGMNVQVGLQDDELRLFIPGQPLLLVPIGPGRFRADGFLWRVTYSEDLATVTVTHEGSVHFIFHRFDEPAQ